MNEAPSNDTIELTAEIVSAYVSKNSLPVAELPTFMKNVHDALNQLLTGKVEEAPNTEELKPAVPIKKSITDDYLISLENGQRFKSLKRHLMSSYNMTPQQYRKKWGLPKDYPMVAPAYAKSRSVLARTLGLGRKATSTSIPDPTPLPAKKRGRPKQAPAATEVTEAAD